MSNADTISRSEHEALVAAALAERDTIIEELRDRVFELEHISEKFQRLLFGRKSEKRFVNPETGEFQGLLFEGDEETPAEPEPAANHKPKSKGKGKAFFLRFGGVGLLALVGFAWWRREDQEVAE